MNRKQLAIVFSIVGLALAAVIVLLVTGAPPQGPVPGADGVSEANDPAGDVTITQGGDAPTEIALADIVAAHVYEADGELSFEVQLGQQVPRRVRGGSLDLRWEVKESGNTTWLLTANFDVGPNASLLTQIEGSSYGSSTFDGSFPGAISVDGDRVVITLRPADLPGDAPPFPESFTWTLSTSLDAAAGDPASALAQDRAPDAGEGSIEQR